MCNRSLDGDIFTGVEENTQILAVLTSEYVCVKIHLFVYVTWLQSICVAYIFSNCYKWLQDYNNNYSGYAALDLNASSEDLAFGSGT